MNEQECDFLDRDGRCEGLYKGFGCIKDKCKQTERTKNGDDYCSKCGKFHSSGQADCESLGK